MAEKDILSCRKMLEFLEKEGELLTIKGKVNPIYEVSGIAKALDNGPALLFQDIEGYPNHRILCNLFSTGERVARMFGVADPRKLKFKGLEAIKNPIPPKVADSGPCQEVVITEDIDVLRTMPIIKHTETDPGRILGGGIVFISGPEIGTCVSYKRCHFRGKDWGSMAVGVGSHFEYFMFERRKENRNLPLTINICPPPAVLAVAGGGTIQATIPVGSDELGIAGGIQGAPVEICKAKTVDTYAIANSEWVIEGYVDTSQVVWESDEAEKKGDWSTPFFPEYIGYEGRARSTYKLQVTGITHRKDNPIFHAPMAHSCEYPYMQCFTNHATLYDFLNRICPGLVVDVNVLQSMKGKHGLVVQVSKRRQRDEGYIKNLILAAFAVCAPIRMVVVVDEDVDIYNADEIIWAIITRVDPREDLVIAPPATMIGLKKEYAVGPLSAQLPRMGFDATVPLEQKWAYWRGEYPQVNLERWLAKEEIAKIRAQQGEYARVLAEKRV